MVHRIQNRNPGYSDFSNNSNISAFNFQDQNISDSMSGANALKLDNEIISEAPLNNEEIKELNNHNDNEQITIQETEHFNQEEVTPSTLNEEQTTSNGLENFALDEETTPELFNDSIQDSSNEEFTSFEPEKESLDDEDELEIPAFLRRQKN